jgi:hypothetical protein
LRCRLTIGLDADAVAHLTSSLLTLKDNLLTEKRESAKVG